MFSAWLRMYRHEVDRGFMMQTKLVGVSCANRVPQNVKYKVNQGFSLEVSCWKRAFACKYKANRGFMFSGWLNLSIYFACEQSYSRFHFQSVAWHVNTTLMMVSCSKFGLACEHKVNPGFVLKEFLKLSQVWIMLNAESWAGTMDHFSIRRLVNCQCCDHIFICINPG